MSDATTQKIRKPRKAEWLKMQREAQLREDSEEFIERYFMRVHASYTDDAMDGLKEMRTLMLDTVAFIDRLARMHEDGRLYDSCTGTKLIEAMIHIHGVMPVLRLFHRTVDSAWQSTPRSRRKKFGLSNLKLAATQETIDE